MEGVLKQLEIADEIKDVVQACEGSAGKTETYSQRIGVNRSYAKMLKALQTYVALGETLEDRTKKKSYPKSKVALTESFKTCEESYADGKGHTCTIIDHMKKTVSAEKVLFLTINKDEVEAAKARATKSQDELDSLNTCRVTKQAWDADIRANSTFEVVKKTVIAFAKRVKAKEHQTAIEKLSKDPTWLFVQSVLFSWGI